jgi:hypothetical protein
MNDAREEFFKKRMAELRELRELAFNLAYETGCLPDHADTHKECYTTADCIRALADAVKAQAHAIELLTESNQP